MQAKNNNLGYLIDSKFRNINRLLVGVNNPRRDSFGRYYMPLIEIISRNALIDNKPLSEQPVQSKQKAHEKLVEMSRKDDYTTGNLLDYLYH